MAEMTLKEAKTEIERLRKEVIEANEKLSEQPEAFSAKELLEDNDDWLAKERLTSYTIAMTRVHEGDLVNATKQSIQKLAAHVNMFAEELVELQS